MKFSSVPVYKAMSREACWVLADASMKTHTPVGKLMARRAGFRHDVRTFSFVFDASKYAPSDVAFA